ncbi:hypothetical protein LCGC14_0190820 [marine sediment metagenome]|uniref:Uncharacterized protein n=1 Tax=marine sediment metagenome TaxID=412755 RepID=A0A0F9X5A5_9ZZZZ
MFQIKLLTDDAQHARICEDYWRQDERGEFVLKVEEIAASHGMKNQDVPKFVKKNAFVWRQDILCMQCKKAYFYTSRAQYKEKYKFRNQVCAACIEAERRDINEKNKSLISEMRRNAREESVELANRDLTSKIYLLSTMKALADKKNTTIEPLRRHPACTLSPDPDYDKKILSHLINKHLLLFSLGTRFDVTDNYQNDNFDLYLETCEFDIAYDNKEISNLSHVLLGNETTSKLKELKEFIDICKEIQLSESLAFLKISLEIHQLPLVTGITIRHALCKCLENFSVSQVYNFIYNGAKDSAAYYMRRSVDKRQAANSATKYISRNMEKSLAYKLHVKPFHRVSSLPQSSLSHLIFDVMLNSKDGGFERPLNELLSSE